VFFAAVEIGDIVCCMIPSRSGYFIRLHIFVPKGFSKFGTTFQDFAIQLEICGCRGAIIHTVSRNIGELCATLVICHLDGVIHTWADFQEQNQESEVVSELRQGTRRLQQLDPHVETI
jgi:hypothetical protein